MHLIGRYTTDVTRIFTITTSSLKSRWNIYSVTALDDSTSVQLMPMDLQRSNLAAYNSYLLSSCICVGKGDIKSAYGNVTLVQQLLKILSDMELLDNIFLYQQDLGTFTQGFTTVEILSVTSSISNVRAISGVNYNPYDGSTEYFRKRLAYSIGKRNLKTYEEVLQTYNIAWMYRDDKLIKDYRLITSEEDLEWVISELSSPAVDLVAIDTETTGLNFFWYGGNTTRRSNICGMSLSWRDDQGIYIPFLSTRVPTMDFEATFSRLYPILAKKHLVAHNGLFDQRVFYSYGYLIKLAHDTMIMEFNIDPMVSKGSKALKIMTRKYFGHETLELEDILGAKFNPELIPEIDGELIKIYACADTDYVLKLYHHLKQFITDPNAYKLDMQITEILSIAEFYSTKIDTNLLETLAEINRRDLATVENILYRYIEEIGMQTQAIKFLKSVYGSEYLPTAAEISEVVNNPTFQSRIHSLFIKQTKKAQTSSNPEDQKLQISSSKDIVHIMYNILDYPVTQIDPVTGNWKANEDAILDLLSYSAEEPVKFLREDVKSAIADYDIPHKPDEEILISKKMFESYQFPFAYLLEKWRALYKFQTSFFNKLQSENTDGWYCTTNSMTSAETARVINPIQTLVGALKRLVVPHSKDYYMVIFDMAQIEFRVMLGLANNYWMALTKVAPPDIFDTLNAKNLEFLIEKLNNAEADYHREGGAIFAGCTPEDMTKAQRSKVKAVHFSVPYGAGAYSIAESRLRDARSDRERADIIADTEATLAAWRKNLYPLYYYLEAKRDKALTQVDSSQLPPLLKGRTWGMVDNPMGRHRWFSLDNLTPKNIAGIRRQAGNYPIQSFAREIFFTAMLRLYKRLKREGYITGKVGEEKVIMSTFIHDECHLQVHKSIHPYKMYKMILEECLIQLKGHPNYYMGISIVDNWEEGKADKFEAPVDFVRQCVHEYDAAPEKFADGIYQQSTSESQKDFVFRHICKYMAHRFRKEIELLQSSEEDPYLIDPKHILKVFKNYFLKTRYWLYTTPNRLAEYDFDPDLSSEENKILKYLDAYLYDDDPNNWARYRILFHGEEIPLSSMRKPDAEQDALNDADSDIITDLSLDLDLDFESDFEEDKREQEEYYRREYYLLTDTEVSVPLRINKATGNVCEEDTVRESPPVWNSVSWEDFLGRVVVNIKGAQKNNVLNATRYLRAFRSDQGRPLIFFDGKELDAKVKVSPLFDKKTLYDILYSSKEQAQSVLTKST